MHSSWRGILSGAFGAGLLTAAGTYGVSQVGFRLFPALLLVGGWLLVLAIVFDYPIASRFSSAGVERRMLLRRQWFDWEDVRQLTRTRSSVMRIDRTLQYGGLALVKGRRRYLLVDRLESGPEYDRMVEVVEATGGAGEGVGASMLPRPGDKVAPTWLYRRDRWKPDWAHRR